MQPTNETARAGVIQRPEPQCYHTSAAESVGAQPYHMVSNYGMPMPMPAPLSAGAAAAGSRISVW
jgi:hypothetical protein